MSTERAVAPAVENPYRFTVTIERVFDGNQWYVNINGFGPDLDPNVMSTFVAMPKAEAREHAALIAAALRNVEVE